jgi:hypothetical protein
MINDLSAVVVFNNYLNQPVNHNLTIRQHPDKLSTNTQISHAYLFTKINGKTSLLMFPKIRPYCGFTRSLMLVGTKYGCGKLNASPAPFI